MVSRAFSGRPARSIATGFVAAMTSPGAPEPAPYPIQRALTAAMRASGLRDSDIDSIEAWAGQSAALAPALPAGESCGNVGRSAAAPCVTWIHGDDGSRHRACPASRAAARPAGASAPGELVRWLGAVQAQDFALSRWSIGQRAACDAKAIDAALADGSIVRTHVLRPTWHFVTREDIGWMLALTRERVRARLRPYDRQNGIDAEMIQTSRRAIEAAIRKSGHLTRERIADILRRRRIRVDSGWIVGHLLMHAELSGTICSGIAQGTQQTYALLEERAPKPAMLAGDDALAELATRYFQSHSPAAPPGLPLVVWPGRG